MNISIIAYRANMGVQTTAPFLNNYSLDFDGVDDYVDLGITTTATNDVSVSCWINTTETFPSTSSRCAFGGTDSTFGSNYTLGRLGSEFSSPNDMKVRVFNTFGSTKLNDGAWHNVVFTYDYTTKEVKAYVDGNTTPEISATVSLFTSKKIAIGWNGATSAFSFQGNVDECALWYSILDVSDISAIYNSGVPTDLTDLSPLAWYRNGDNGSYKSPQWLIPSNENKDKVSNYSFELDGVDDRIDTAAIDLGLENTVSFWAKRNGTNFNGVVWGGIAQSNYYTVFLTSANTLNYRIGGGANTFNDSDIVLAVGADAWFHCALVRNNGGADVLCYINGDLKQTLSAIVGSANNTIVRNIGSRGPTPLDFEITGFLDEMSLFNSALSQSDVTEIYNGGEPTTISGAVAHYKMGEDATFSGGVWTVPDSVGSNNGTSNAMTIEDRIGEAPNSTSNSVSINMDEVDRVTDVPT
jgi:hypothetical protein